MRWKEAEEEIRVETAGGVVLRLQDAAALGGPKVLLQTPNGFSLLVDEQTKKINEVGEELTTLQQEATRKVMRVLTEEQREKVRAAMAPKTRKGREKKAAE